MTLEYWSRFGQQGGEVEDRRVAEFNAASAPTAVVRTLMNNDYTTQHVAAFSAGSGPDAYGVGSTSIPSFSRIDAALTLDGYAASKRELPDFIPDAIDSCKYQGKINGSLSGGPWADGAIHGIDEVRWITGLEYQEVVAYDANVSAPREPRFYDHGQALFRMGHGIAAIVEHHRQSINDSWLSILGTAGKIEIDRRNQGVFVDASGERPLSEVVAFPPARNVFADFCESLGAGRPALVDTEDTLATMEAVFAVRTAARTGQTVRLGA